MDAQSIFLIHPYHYDFPHKTPHEPNKYQIHLAESTVPTTQTSTKLLTRALTVRDLYDNDKMGIWHTKNHARPVDLSVYQRMSEISAFLRTHQSFDCTSMMLNLHVKL